MGTGLALRETRKPNSLTNRVLNGYFNDTEMLALTFIQKQFSQWSWQTTPDPSPPGLLGNQGPRSSRCFQNIWPALRCRPLLSEIKPTALAFEDPNLIKDLAATGRGVEHPVTLVNQVITVVENISSGTTLVGTNYQCVSYR